MSSMDSRWRRPWFIGSTVLFLSKTQCAHQVAHTSQREREGATNSKGQRTAQGDKFSIERHRLPSRSVKSLA